MVDILWCSYKKNTISYNEQTHTHTHTFLQSLIVSQHRLKSTTHPPPFLNHSLDSIDQMQLNTTLLYLIGIGLICSVIADGFDAQPKTLVWDNVGESPIKAILRLNLAEYNSSLRGSVWEFKNTANESYGNQPLILDIAPFGTYPPDDITLEPGKSILRVANRHFRDLDFVVLGFWCKPGNISYAYSADSRRFAYCILHYPIIGYMFPRGPLLQPSEISTVLEHCGDACLKSRLLIADEANLINKLTRCEMKEKSSNVFQSPLLYALGLLGLCVILSPWFIRR